MNDLASLSKLELALKELAGVDRGGLYLHHALALLVIQRHGSCTYGTLGGELGISNPAVSRTLNSLAEQTPHRKTSYGLVEIWRDPSNGRRYQVSLTPKGHRLIDKLKTICIL